MRVASIHRYPIKSLGGETLPEASVRGNGVEGDRALALQDVETGAVVSGKNPRRWPRIRELVASHGADSVTIRTPAGERIATRDHDAEVRLSSWLGRRVQILSELPAGAKMHRLWPAVPDLAPAHVRDAAVPVDGPDVTAGPLALLAPGTFFDAAPLHLVFAPSLRHLGALSASEVDAGRFRPNLVIDGDDTGAFVEDVLIGSELAIGSELVLRIDLQTPRCIVPSLPAGELPGNLDLLRALARHHRVELQALGAFACFGVYASVMREGVVRCGDPVTAA